MVAASTSSPPPFRPPWPNSSSQSSSFMSASCRSLSRLQQPPLPPHHHQQWPTTTGPRSSRSGRTSRLTLAHYGKPLICCVSHVCREQENGHTAKRSFAVCPRSNTRQTKGTRQISMFTVCLVRKHTGKIIHTTNSKFCRVLRARHTANT